MLVNLEIHGNANICIPVNMTVIEQGEYSYVEACATQMCFFFQQESLMGPILSQTNPVKSSKLFFGFFAFFFVWKLFKSSLCNYFENP